MKDECPCCSSTDVYREYPTHTYAAPYGPTVTYKRAILTCRNCHESVGDDELDEKITAMIDAANAVACDNILATLADAGLSAVSIERVLGLPMRTLTRRSDGTYSPEVIALLRIVRKRPEILLEDS